MEKLIARLFSNVTVLLRSKKKEKKSLETF